MICPRCETTLDERDRDGILVDHCPRCRGVWLDRGELEKLISRASREYAEYAQSYQRDDTPPRGVRYERDDDERHRYPPHHRKRSWLESLGDIFD
jgi:Zn-finger nucleic acid-binding protein